MENNWAAENLQTIRTLMERSAIYRRALAPISTYVGIVGIVAAIGGWAFKIEDTALFVLYWMAVSLVALLGALILVRRQAIKHAEPFWSPPARRIAQAMFPALAVGCLSGVIILMVYGGITEHIEPEFVVLLVSCWCILYGLALHAAAFFILRGVRLFAWSFVLAGNGLLWIAIFKVDGLDLTKLSPWLMGILFGASHLAYGIYLYFTEPRKNEA